MPYFVHFLTTCSSTESIRLLFSAYTDVDTSAFPSTVETQHVGKTSCLLYMYMCILISITVLKLTA